MSESLKTTELHDLVDRIQAGDRQAADDLIRRSAERLENLARKMLRGFPDVRRWEETGDVFQTAITRLLRTLRDVTPDSVAGFFRLAAQALLPPPMPFKIFVATAGALQFPRRRFLLTILVARSLRYYIEGTLAVFYGERVGRFLKDNGLLIISVVAGLCLIALAAYLLSSRGRAAVARGKEES